MILVDSSVWIDYFKGAENSQTLKLDSLLDSQPLAIGDLILVEVLQGCRSDHDFERVRTLLTALSLVQIGGHDVAVQAARNFRHLRGLGSNVRKTIDVVIATRCIVSGYSLLHNDRDFEPFEHHLGLRVVSC